MSISYDSLVKIVATQKPYRGRENHYPTHGRAYRRHGHKFFIPDTINDEVVFRVNYGNGHRQVTVTPEQANLLKKLGKSIHSGKNTIYNTQQQCWEEEEHISYWYYELEPDEIGIVYPDNTFEFTNNNNLGQGMRYYLTEYVLPYPSNVYTDCRRGGVTINGTIPIFKGLRINLETGKPVENQGIELYKKTIDRVAAKQLMADYKEMFSVSKVMFSQMDDKLFVETFKEVLNDNKVRWEWKHDVDYKDQKFTDTNEVMQIAEQLRIKGDYFDSALLYGYGLDLGGVVWRIRHNHTWVKKDMFVNMDRYMRKAIYRKNEPFKLKRMEFGAGLGSSEWGFDIRKDGKSVKQYSW